MIFITDAQFTEDFRCIPLPYLIIGGYLHFEHLQGHLGQDR
jgi:hypothetical protein